MEKRDAPQAQYRKLSAIWGVGEHRFDDAYLTRRRVQSDIQMLHYEKVDQPWFVAMSKESSLSTARGYSKR